MKRLVVLVSALVLLVIAGVVGQGAGLTTSTPADPSGPIPADARRDATSPLVGPDPAARDASSARDMTRPTIGMVAPPIGLPTPGDGSALARAAQLRVFSKDVRAIADRVRAIIETNGGTIYSLSLRSDELMLTARVPMTKFVDVNAAVSGTGQVEGFTTNVTDVSGAIASDDASLKNLQAQAQTLIDQIDRTKDATTIATLRRQLADIQNQIDLTNAQRRAQQFGVDTYVLDVNVANTHVDSPPKSEPSMLSKALTKAGALFLTVTGGLLIIGAALAPLLALVAVLLLVARLVRRFGHNHATQGLSGAAQ